MPGSSFDFLESTMMDIVTAQFGYSASYSASWTPSGGGAALLGTVLFKSPSAKEQVQTINFDGDTNYSMEFRKGVFDGLVAAVQNTRNKEVVVIDGVTYNCRFVKAKYDGDTYVITLELPD